MSVDHQHNLDHVDDKFIIISYALYSWSKGRLVGPKFYSFCGHRFKSCVKHSFFVQIIFLLGEILHLKVLGFSISKVCVDDQHSHGI